MFGKTTIPSSSENDKKESKEPLEKPLLDEKKSTPVTRPFEAIMSTLAIQLPSVSRGSPNDQSLDSKTLDKINGSIEMLRKMFINSMKQEVKQQGNNPAELFVLPLTDYADKKQSHGHNAFSAISSFIAEKQKILLILGDAGQGKTLLMKMLAWRLWQDYEVALEDKRTGIVPLYIYLPDITTSRRQKELLKTFLENNGVGHETGGLLKLHQPVLLLLDGFDEIDPRFNLYQENNWHEWHDLRTIITCRPEAFGREEKYAEEYFCPSPGLGNSLHSVFSQMNLHLFEGKQIGQYIDSYLQCRSGPELAEAGEKWQKTETYQHHLKKIPALRELARTPLLLSMLIPLLPDMVKDSEREIEAELKKAIAEEKERSSGIASERKMEFPTVSSEAILRTMTRAKLYDTFTKKWFARQAKRSPLKDIKLTNRGNVIRYCRLYAENLAYRALRNNKLKVEFDKEETLEPSLLKPHYEETCTLFVMDSLPDEKKPEIPMDAAYVRYKDQLFYINRVHKECDDLKLSQEAIQQFDVKMRPINIKCMQKGKGGKEPLKFQELSRDALKKIKKITRHTHLSYEMDKEELEKNISSFRSACLLKVSHENEKFAFMHKSLIEYFTSQTLFKGIYARAEFYIRSVREALEAKDLEDAKKLSGFNQHSIVHLPQVMKFLANRVAEDPVFKKILWDLILLSREEAQAAVAAANAISILNMAGESFAEKEEPKQKEGKKEEEKGLQGIRIPGANLSGANCDHANFKGADLREVLFYNAWLAGADFTGAILTDAQFGSPYIKISGRATCCAYSPDGNWLAIGNEQGYINIYRMDTLETTGRLNNFSYWVTPLRYNEITDLVFIDNNFLVASSKDGYLRKWDIRNSQCKVQKQGYQGSRNIYPNTIAYDPVNNEIASGGFYFIELWDTHLNSKRILKTSNSIYTLAYHSDGETLASAGYDICFWKRKAEKNNMLVFLKREYFSSFYEDVTWHPTGEPELATINKYCGILRILNTKTNRSFDIFLPEPKEWYWCSDLAYSHDGQGLLIVNKGQIYFWNRNSPEFLDEITWLSSYIDMPSRVWSSYYNNFIYHWPKLILKNPSYLANFQKRLRVIQQGASLGHTKKIFSLAWRPDGMELASGDVDGTVCFWETETKTEKNSLRKKIDGSCYLFYQQNELELISKKNVKDLISSGMDSCNSDEVVNFACSPDRQMLATLKQGEVWSLTTNKLLCRLTTEEKGHTEIIGLSFNPTQPEEIAGVVKATIRVSPLSLSSMEMEDSIVAGLAIALGMYWMIYPHTRYAYRLYLWHLPTWKMRRLQMINLETFLEYSKVSLSYRPDGKILACGFSAAISEGAERNSESVIYLWATKTGRKLRVLHGHHASINTLAWTSNGELLASGDSQGKILLWDMRAGNCFRVDCGHEEITTLAWRPRVSDQKESYLAAGLSNGVLLYFKTVSKGCDLVLMPSPPDEENMSNLQIKSSTAYVRSENRLFYVDKDKKECSEIKLTPEKLSLFDSEMKASSAVVLLTKEQLEKITSITGHTLSKEAKKAGTELRLLWSTRPLLTLGQAIISQAIGLTPRQQLLFEQHGVTDKPASATIPAPPDPRQILDSAAKRQMLDSTAKKYSLCLMSDEDLESDENIQPDNIYIRKLYKDSLEYAVRGVDNKTVYRSFITPHQLGVKKFIDPIIDQCKPLLSKIVWCTLKKAHTQPKYPAFNERLVMPKKAYISAEQKSLVNPSHIASYDQWIISIIRKDDTNHVFLIIEGIDAYGRGAIMRYDLFMFEDCDILSTASLPRLNPLEILPAGSKAAYVRVQSDAQDQLFYMNKKNKTCTEIKINKEKLKKFDENVLNCHPVKEKLSSDELDTIISITNHRHENEDNLAFIRSRIKADILQEKFKEEFENIFYSKKDRDKKNFYSLDWQIPRFKAIELYQSMQADVGKLLPYHLLGDRSWIVMAKDARGTHNCFTWIRQKLLNLGLQQISDKLKESPLDKLVAHSKYYINLPPQSKSKPAMKASYSSPYSRSKF